MNALSKILICISLSLISLLINPLSVKAQNLQTIDYGLVKFITPSGEFNKDEACKFAFTGNEIFEFPTNTVQIELMDGTSSNYHPYGKLIGSNDGNLMYQKYEKGKGIMGSYNRIVENEYYVVSPDRSIINRIIYNSIGEVQYVYVYKKKNKPSGQLHY